MTPPPPPVARPALLVDVAEWFQAPELAARLSRRHWRRLPSRVAPALDRAMELLAAHGATATFFVTGELAERDPALLRRIVAAGHEVASAGDTPRDLCGVPFEAAAEFFAALARGRAAIEAATGLAVHGYRAAWSPHACAAWWRDALRAAGYAYDATCAAAPCAARHGLGRAAVLPFLGQPFEAVAVRLADLDPALPRLTGLPRHVVAAVYGAAGAVPRLLQQRLAAAPSRSVAAVLGLAAAAAPGREPPPPAAAASRPVAVATAPRLAVVVPMKDEADGLPSLLSELERLRAELADLARLEFVFVDDGSTDATWQQLQQGAGHWPHARSCRHPHNRGVAAAIATGIAATDAEWVASIDADLSYDPDELRRMLALAAAADVVTASPYHPRGGVRNVPRWRLLLSRTLSRAYRLCTGAPVHTWTSCYRIYRRAAVADLRLQEPGFLGTAELLVRVLRRGGRVVEHPCVLEARLFGVSKMKVLRTILGHLRLLARVVTGRVR